jgi:hypothetical protein
MAINTKISLDNSKVVQLEGNNLTLCGNTVIDEGTGNLSYSIHPTFTGDTQVVDKQYVDESILTATGSTVYNLASPATTTVGGITAGTTLTGKTSNCLLKEILTPYQSPTLSTFSNNVSTPVEVGCTISGSKSFSWTFTNSANVQANTMCIRDVTLGANLSTNISTTSPQSASITSKQFTSCGDTQVWCGSAKNSCNIQFNSGSYTVTGLLPYFWGKCTCPGPAGSNRPVGTPTMVTGGTKVVADSSGSISINFNSGSNDYLWFAVPATVSSKTCWYVDAINNGAIGGGISPACNLFPAPTTTGVTTVCWSGCSYKVYISNKQTAQSLSIAIS